MIFLILGILCSVVFTNANNTIEYTPAEKDAIEELRPLVDDILTHDYMREDVYLIRFLTAKNFDNDDSVELIQNAMKWRRENNIDNIMNEDFSNMHKHMPLSQDGKDKEGRPIVIMSIGRWDFRKFTLMGRRRDNATRYWDRLLEEFEIKIRDLGKGTNVTQGIVIMDLDRCNFKQHGCLACASLYVDWLGHYENYYPELLKSLILINVPGHAHPLLKMLKPFMSSSTNTVLQVFSPDKKEWSKELLTIISADQLTPQYGGTKSVK